jgi:hypothetical protein
MRNPQEFLQGLLQQAQDEFTLGPQTIVLLEALTQQPLSRPAFDDVVAGLADTDLSTFREDLRKVLVVGIAQCLADHRVTLEEQITLRYLRALFGIDDGDLYQHCRPELVDLLRAELVTLADEKESSDGSTPHAVLLQELLGLSYDQFLELLDEARGPVGGLVKAGPRAPASTEPAEMDEEEEDWHDILLPFTLPDPLAVRCPNCGSDQVSGGNKGFGLGKAAGGYLLMGPLGLFGGLVGSKKVVVSCLSCGHRWEPKR